MIFALTSLWLGILTSISPCPLATNIAAVSFVGKRIDNPLYVLLNGFVYTLGRTLFYVVLGMSLAVAMQNIPMVSHFLQTKMMFVLAPLMVVIGVVMLNILPIKLPQWKMGQKSTEKLAAYGLVGSFLLGILFASALCAVSAALFFSNLISSQGSFIGMLMYGIGTGLPVMAFAFVLAFSVNRIGAVYKATALIEKYARTFTAVLFIGIGIYYLWRIL